MDYDRLYSYRFSGIDQEHRGRVWKEISRFMYARLGRPETVLDPAAGRGEFINAMPSRERWAVDVVDMRQYMQPGVRFEQGDIRTCALPERYFDAIFVSNFLEHLPDPEAIYRFLVRMRGALKDTGVVAIMGPNFRYCPDQYFDCADHILALTEIAVAEHLYSAGFRPQSVIPRFLPYSFRGRLPTAAALVSLYLKIPLAWRVLGRQFLVIAGKDTA